MKKYKFLNIAVVFLILYTLPGCSPSVKTHQHDDEESTEEHHDGIIELSEKQMNTVGIELGSFSTMAMGESVNAAGELSVDPRNTADATSLFNGIIKDIRVREGDYVKAGAVVATIETFEIINLVRDYKEALSNLRLAESEYERQKKLSSHGAGIAKNLERAAIEYESAKSSVASYRTQMNMSGINLDQIDKSNKISAVVKSPVSGVVTKIYGNIGSEAGNGRPILSVTDNSGLYALVRIYEKDFEKIKKGMPVEIALTNGSGIIRGKVEDVIRAIDAESKTIDVRITLLDTDKNRLLPGMAVNACINTEETEVPVLPEQAVVSLEGRDYIYVLDEKENHDGETFCLFKPIEVVKGNSRNGFVEVNPVEELPQDAKIVISKAFYIASMSADHGEHNH